MNWFCVHTRPSKEAQVAAYLVTQFGVEVYFPRLKQRKTIRRVRRVVVSPLFPCYIFCRFDISVHHRAVCYAPDVTGIVSFGHSPAVVADDLIRSLKDWAGNEIDLISIDQDFHPGESVEIVDGPLQGLRAVVLRSHNDRERVTVLLSLLESPAQMVIDRSKIIKSA